MPIPYADIVAGQPIIDDSYYNEGFVDDFNTIDTDGLDTSGSYHVGKWKEGIYSDSLTRFGLVWGHDSPFGPAQINDERQMYVSKKYKHPYGWRGLHLTPQGLAMTSRRVDMNDPVEQAFAMIKGYPMNPNGSRGPFSQSVQATYLSPFLSTYNRYTMGFGRTRSTCQVPYGATMFDGDITKQECMFAAIWGLQAVHRGRGVNGEVLNQNNNDTTYGPARASATSNPNPSFPGQREPRYFEIDDMENFGPEFEQVHQTLHWTEYDGSGIESQPSTYNVGRDVSRHPIEVGRDVLPNKIAFHVDGVYTLVLDTPDELQQALKIATTVPNQPYNPNGFTNDYQVHDGTTDRRWMQFAQLMNVARDASLTRNQMRLRYNSGYCISPNPSMASMYVRKVEMMPLKTSEGNPDVKNVTVNGIFVETDNCRYEDHKGNELS